jgi:hypothetical protein
MKKRNSLHYKLYGSSARGEKKGYWRCKNPLLVGAFYDNLEEAKAQRRRQ